MTGPGLGGSATPRASVRELERFLTFTEKFGSDEDRRSFLREVIDATKAYQEAREKAEAAEAAAAKRVSDAEAIEADAANVRAAISEELETAEAVAAQRETDRAEQERVFTERVQAADARDAAQNERDEQLAVREDHLRAAGVVMPTDKGD